MEAHTVGFRARATHVFWLWLGLLALFCLQGTSVPAAASALDSFVLDGPWDLYWGALLLPEEIGNREPDAQIELPLALSNQSINGEQLFGQGAATLRTVIPLPDGVDRWALKANYLASSNQVFIAGQLRGANGVVSLTPEGFQSNYRPVLVEFPSQIDRDRIEIVIQVANFHHDRMRLSPVILGPAEEIFGAILRDVLLQALLAGGLLVLAVYYAILYLIRRDELAPLYLALIAIMAALRAGVVHERLWMRLFPDLGGEWLMKIGYLPTFVLLPLLLLYVQSFFDAKELAFLIPWLRGSIAASTALVVLTPLPIYDQALNFFLLPFLLVSGYSVYLIMSRPTFRKSYGFTYLAIGSILLLLAAANDLFREFDRVQTPELMSKAMLAFVLLQALFLAWKYHAAFTDVRRLATENQEMFEKIHSWNRDLELRIADRTQELADLNETLESLNRQDPLTKIANRRSFQEFLDAEWKRAVRQGSTLAVIMADIDMFKQYNDFYGHVQGDECLIRTAQVLQNTVNRDSDCTARYGGEEFCILLPGTDLKGAQVVAERMRCKVLAAAMEHGANPLYHYVTISLGCAVLEPDSRLASQELVERADQALYEAKRSGRNRVVAYGHT